MLPEVEKEPSPVRYRFSCGDLLLWELLGNCQSVSGIWGRVVGPWRILISPELRAVYLRRTSFLVNSLSWPCEVTSGDEGSEEVRFIEHTVSISVSVGPTDRFTREVLAGNEDGDQTLFVKLSIQIGITEVGIEAVGSRAIEQVSTCLCRGLSVLYLLCYLVDIECVTPTISIEVTCHDFVDRDVDGCFLTGAPSSSVTV